MGHSRREMETASLRLVLADPNVDAAMAVIGAYDPLMGEEYQDMIRGVARDFPDKRSSTSCMACTSTTCGSRLSARGRRSHSPARSARYVP